MQAPRFLHTLLTSSLPAIHAKRLQALLDVVGALLGERRLGVTALGRALPGSAAPKHAIKRVDRLLGNHHLHQERPLFYWLVASLLIGHTTLVTEAGFRNSWFKAVEARGWYYVGRVRSPTRCQVSGAAWRPVTALFQHSTSVPQALGSVQIAESNPLATRMVLYHRPPKGRKHRDKRGQVSQDGRNQRMAQRQKEPWVLVSNLPERSTLADKLVAIYWQRMQIEEGFRDIKSPLFGLGFGMHQSRIRHRNVLSVWRLGLEWLRRHRVGTAPWPSWKTLQASLREEIRGQALCDG